MTTQVPFLHNKSDIFSKEEIKRIEFRYDAVYMGQWCLKDEKDGGWINRPIDVFYANNPDKSKGHKNYFALFYEYNRLHICDATSAFSEPIYGVMTPKGEVLVSRYRHDYIEKEGCVIDGGRDYSRGNGKGTPMRVNVNKFNFVFEKVGVVNEQ